MRHGVHVKIARQGAIISVPRDMTLVLNTFLKKQCSYLYNFSKMIDCSDGTLWNLKKSSNWPV